MTRSPAPRVRVFPTLEALTEEAARTLRRDAAAAVTRRGRFTLALVGGQTPEVLYRLLGAAGPRALPYPRLEIFWSDERAVPPGHRDSNYRLAWEIWLSRVPVDPRRVHRIRGEEGPDAAAARYERELRRTLGIPPRLDLILLGVGRDGHTASLFPHAPALRSARLVEAAVAPASPRKRVTFTPALIGAARRVLVLAAGREKARVVERALAHPPSDTVPASLLRGRNVSWLLDRAAAARLVRGHE
ncbi:MAG: 6-phosphogluconolactonase [Armatimonadetes bacterium]|nr:6-phosphogluconolactonase [Armatimonadota bacterium]